MAVYVSKAEHAAGGKQAADGEISMPAPFYLGWAVMAVLALGSADMLLRVAGNMLRGHAGANKKVEPVKRHLPKPKAVENRPRGEMWF
jgi:hypothetical protein